MGFRVSSSGGFLLFQKALGTQNQNQARIYEQLSSGKKISRPSDDPLNAQAIISMKETLSRIEQFDRNLKAADARWTQIESEVSSVNDIFVRARELAIQANNGTLGAQQRQMMATEVRQLAQQALSIANRQVNGEYIFAGYRTDTRPFAFAASYPDATPAVVYSGDQNIKQIEISEGSFFDIQMRGDVFFTGGGSSGSVSPMQVLANLEQALLNNNVDDDDPGSVGQAIEDLGTALEQIQSSLADVGARSNRIELSLEQLGKQSVLAQKFLSETEEVDLGQVAYEFSRAQVALQATISSASALLNRPSLIDFLR